MYEALFQNLVAELEDGIQFTVALREDLLSTVSAVSTTEEQTETAANLKVQPCLNRRV